MKRKLVSVLLAAAMSATVFGGCAQRADQGNSEDLPPAYTAVLPTGVEEADIYVQKIDGLSDSFIKGMDISSLLAEEASGVIYYDTDGTQTDVFRILADAGVNYIRVRVWNDPFDADGRGYGGGNCNVDTAAELGKRAAAYGMKLCVDFHYSDFWADPAKQFAPKEWQACSLQDKEELLYNYTKESLQTILAAGADVGMVQIGNEINHGMAGETTFTNVAALLKAGSKAVREVSSESGKEMQIVVHYTEIDNSEETLKIAGKLSDVGLDYDIFGVSYYCYWHGTMENMTNVLKNIREQYGVSTCVMETSYAYTAEDGDESGNSISGGDLLLDYPASPQGQANCVRDVMAAASEAGALGVFYWEGAWIPVGSSYSTNHEIWEEKGSGWASSYASAYDPKDAGQYYGGSSWDNQAFFDFQGHVLPSLDVFKYVNYGATGHGLEILALKDISMEVGIQEELNLPNQVEAVYNDTSCRDLVDVTWDDTQLAAVDTNEAGTYLIDGVSAAGKKVQAKIKVANINYVQNPSFEEDDMSMWTVSTDMDVDPTDVQDKAADAYSGSKAFHFYHTSDMEFAMEQKISGLAAGTYNAAVNLQGGDVGDDAQIYLYVKVNDNIIQSETVILDGWVNWKTPVLTDIEVDETDDVIIGVAVKAAAKGWGTIDDFEFYSQR